MKKELLRILVLIHVGMLIVLLAGGCSDDSGGSSTDPIDDTGLKGKIAFVSYDDGDGEIYIMNADGSNLIKLTDNSVNDIEPVFSPDGSKIAFNSWGYQAPSEIYVMDADGSNIVQVTHDPVNINYGENRPSWSSDGTSLVFESYRDAESEDNGTTIINANLYIANADGSGGDFRITNHLFYDGEPSWAPDDSKITFVHAQVDTINNNLYSSGYQIHVMDANGTNWVKLTTIGSSNLCPKWSPDGSNIVYSSDEGISVVNLNGIYSNLVGYGSNPSWSPDGTKIIFDGANDLYIMNSDGSDVKILETTVGARQAVWTE
ncbi:MAG: hypothetical protein AB7T22_17400 [Calditrichaceae bacterium]